MTYNYSDTLSHSLSLNTQSKLTTESESLKLLARLAKIERWVLFSTKIKRNTKENHRKINKSHKIYWRFFYIFDVKIRIYICINTCRLLYLLKVLKQRGHEN